MFGRQGRKHGQPRSCLTERGTSFGYNTLVADMRALPEMIEDGLSRPHGRDTFRAAAGRPGRQFGRPARIRPRSWRAPPSRWASRASSSRRMKTPTRAPSDGPNMIPLDQMPALIDSLMAFDRLANPIRSGSDRVVVAPQGRQAAPAQAGSGRRSFRQRRSGSVSPGAIGARAVCRAAGQACGSSSPPSPMNCSVCAIAASSMMSRGAQKDISRGAVARARFAGCHPGQVGRNPHLRPAQRRAGQRGDRVQREPRYFSARGDSCFI